MIDNSLSALKDLGTGLLSQAKNPWQYLCLGLVLCLVVFNKDYEGYKEGFLLIALGLGYIIPSIFTKLLKYYDLIIGNKLKVRKSIKKLDSEERFILIEEMIKKDKGSYTVNGMFDIESENVLSGVKDIEHKYNILRFMTAKKGLGILCESNTSMTFVLSDYAKKILKRTYLDENKKTYREYLSENKKSILISIFTLIFFFPIIFYVISSYKYTSIEYEIKYMETEDKDYFIKLLKGGSKNFSLNTQDYNIFIFSTGKLEFNKSEYAKKLSRYQSLEALGIIKQVNMNKYVIEYTLTNDAVKIISEIIEKNKNKKSSE